MAYALFTQSFGPNSANSKVTISEVSTGAPAVILATASGGIVSDRGIAQTDSSGNLSVYIDTAKTWRVAVVEEEYVPVQPGSVSTIVAWAGSLDSLISGSITRDSNGAATTAAVVWPDGATGVYTATTVSTAFPGAVDAYSITHVLGGVTLTVTQAAVTRDSSGAVINRPAITVA